MSNKSTCTVIDVEVSGTHWQFRALMRWPHRLRGLLGTSEDTMPVALIPCSSVHTWCMGYSLDIACFSSSGRVLASQRHVLPGQVITCPHAKMICERPATDAPWFEVGAIATIRCFQPQKVGEICIPITSHPIAKHLQISKSAPNVMSCSSKI